MVLALFSVVFSGGVIGLYHVMKSQRMENELGLQMGVVAAHTAPLILQAHRKNDFRTQQALMKSLFAFPAIQCVMLTQNNLSAQNMLASWPSEGCRLEQASLSLPLKEGGATLHLVTDTAYAFEEVRRSTALFAAFLGSILVGILGLVLMLIGRFMLSPLLRLRQAMEQSAPDNPVLARDLTDDEIGQLGRAYNRLAAAARRFFAQLRETEKQVRQSETRFKDMAEISGDWFYEMDAQLQFSYVSDRFFEITGLDKQAVLGKTRQMMAETVSQQPQLTGHLNRLDARDAFRDFEYVIKKGDGQQCYISVSGKPIYNDEGVFTGYRGTGRDITLLREKERLLAEANRNFGDSVSYASRFQHRLLTRPEQLSESWGDTELIWQPRDMVGGDFLKSFSVQHHEYLICFDCTGHGVPGAFMVMIVSAAIDRIIYRAGSPPDPLALLHDIHYEVCQSLHLAPDEVTRDGLDCAVLCYDTELQQMRYAGASIDLFILNAEGEVDRIQASNTKLGYVNQPLPATLHTYECRLEGQCFVLMTDGLSTQIGRQSQTSQLRMMGVSHVLNLLRDKSAAPSAPDNSPRAVTRRLMRGLRLWQGQQERRDDVMMLAVRPR